jgi:trehalose 6-phosphate synthase/phosphatase
VGRINGRFGTLGSVPIQHLDCSLAFTELCALYAVTDVCLVTSLRDGMNLVSYEFVACQSKNAGVLVLSEFAGAAQSLGAGALLVNPWNVNDMAAALEDALTMPEPERRERQRQNFTHITMHTAQAWADTFVSELNDTHVEAELRRKRIPPQLFPSRVLDDFSRSRHRLIILGYNATLTLQTDSSKKQSRAGVLPGKPIKTQSRMHPVSQECLQRLCDDPTTTLCIFSGSERNRLQQTFAHLPKLWIAAENGCFIRPPLEGKHSKLGGSGTNNWITMVETSNFDWIESVQLVFDYFCERTPRSYVETRETSLVWSYKYADPDFGRQQARDLLQHLWTGPISNAAVDVIQGAKSVEVRPIGVSKGAAVERIVSMMGECGSSSLVEEIVDVPPVGNGGGSKPAGNDPPPPPPPPPPPCQGNATVTSRRSQGGHHLARSRRETRTARWRDQEEQHIVPQSREISTLPGWSRSMSDGIPYRRDTAVATSRQG